MSDGVLLNRRCGPRDALGLRRRAPRRFARCRRRVRALVLARRAHDLDARSEGRAQAGDVAPRRTGGRATPAQTSTPPSPSRRAASSGAPPAASAPPASPSLIRAVQPPRPDASHNLSRGAGIASSLAGAARRGDMRRPRPGSPPRFRARRRLRCPRRAALVPEQTVSGRSALPPVDAVLAAALRDQDPAAVARRISGARRAGAGTAEPEVPATEPPPIQETRPCPACAACPPTT